jgi:cytochrome P450
VFPLGLDVSLFPRDKLHDRMCHYAEEHGGLCQFFVGTDPMPRVLVSDFEAVKEIRQSGSYLLKTPVLPHDLEYHDQGVLFNNNLPVWKEQRRAVVHTLMHVKHLRKVAQCTVEACERREAEWSCQAGALSSVTVRMDEVMMKLALEVVVSAAFSSSAERVTEMSDQIQEDSKIIIRSVDRFGFLPRWLSKLLSWRAVQRGIAARRRICGVLERITTQRLEDIRLRDINQSDIIDMLINVGTVVGQWDSVSVCVYGCLDVCILCTCVYVHERISVRFDIRAHISVRALRADACARILLLSLTTVCFSRFPLLLCCRRVWIRRPPSS